MNVTSVVHLYGKNNISFKNVTCHLPRSQISFYSCFSYSHKSCLQEHPRINFKQMCVLSRVNMCICVAVCLLISLWRQLFTYTHRLWKNITGICSTPKYDSPNIKLVKIIICTRALTSLLCMEFIKKTLLPGFHRTRNEFARLELQAWYFYQGSISPVVSYWSSPFAKLH